VNLAIAALVFPIIALGELPDKTMFASLVLSTRGKPLSVWAGAAAAFLVHVAIAVTVGALLFRVVPHRAVSAIVAVMFLAGAALSLREALAERRVEDRQQRLIDAESGSHRVFATAFLVVFLAEWGDLTQILIANLAVHYHSPASVALGSLAALWVVSALAVLGGRGLLRILNVVAIRLATAGILLVLALVAGAFALS
jgi:putative Ca2+/H+ antiporter (TMEM165/GDT1 family)